MFTTQPKHGSKSCGQSVGESSHKSSWATIGFLKAVEEFGRTKKGFESHLEQVGTTKKKAAREARALKAKASKTDLGELLQMMMMMKAYIVGEEEKTRSSDASSSSEPWIPQNAKDAFQKFVRRSQQEGKRMCRRLRICSVMQRRTFTEDSCAEHCT